MAVTNFGFIGAGRMATALAQGIIAAELAGPTQLIAHDPDPDALARFREATLSRAVASNQAVVESSNVVFLCVKPAHAAEALKQIRESASAKHLVISVAAGVTLSALSSGLGPAPRLIRVMPNTPCLVRQGASGFCLGQNCTPDDRDLATRLLQGIGTAHELDEKLLDAVTGLSGSGPAFVFLIIEALADGGVRAGLPRQVALALAAQTVRGAAELLIATGEHPGQLKDQVASPGGTTIAGLHVLETAGVRGALIEAVVAATRRSAELAALAKDPSPPS